MYKKQEHIRITRRTHRWWRISKTQPPKAKARGQRLADWSVRSQLLAMLLALAAGVMHIGHLWLAPLAIDTLLDAGRGVILLLIALGLMGSARLSLILACLICAGSLIDLVAMSSTMSPISWVELSLLGFALIALLLQSAVSAED
jgi:hypothetical protein